jgi:hypothetical protein
VRTSTADYLRKALAEMEREIDELAPFSTKRLKMTDEANLVRDILRRAGEETR